MASCSCRSVITPRSRRIRPSMGSALLREPAILAARRAGALPGRRSTLPGRLRVRGMMPATPRGHARAHCPLSRAAPGPRAGAGRPRQPRRPGPRRLPLAAIEDEYGTPAYEEVRQRLFKILEESRGKDYRGGTSCASTGRGACASCSSSTASGGGTCPSRWPTSAPRASASSPRSSRSSPRPRTPTPGRAPSSRRGLRPRPLQPPLHTERVIERAIESAALQATQLRQLEEIGRLERLQDILLRERVVTCYQPILRMQEGTVMGFEALSRGPKGSGLESAGELFEAARVHGSGSSSTASAATGRSSPRGGSPRTPRSS